MIEMWKINIYLQLHVGVYSSCNYHSLHIPQQKEDEYVWNFKGLNKIVRILIFTNW